MKIGILTYHRAENYGALLQAYALKTYLKSLGHDVSFVDYWPNYHKRYFELFSWKKFMEGSIREKLVLLYYLFFWNSMRKKRKKNLQAFMYEELGLLPKVKYYSDSDVVREFDVVFYGSDQIWRKQKMKSHPGYDFWYLGSENVKARKIAYAASMGNTEVKEAEKAAFRDYLSKFETISVREDSLKEFLASLGVEAQQVCDPVFLLPRIQWEGLAKKSTEPLPYQHYILVYNLLGNSSTVKFSEQLSREKGLPIVEVNKKYVPFTGHKLYNRTARVEEFLSLIAQADYVVSNSFHGVALSLIFQRQFFAVGMGKRAGRVISLLNTLKISERYKENYSSDYSPIDYNLVDEQANVYAADSKMYIKTALSSRQ